MPRAILLALAVGLVVAIAASGAVVCPNGGIDADGDDICDSGWNRTCCCGEKVECNDNWVDLSPGINSNNANQRDYDCDCVGNGGLSGPAASRVLDFGGDRCPFHYDPSNSDGDGDGIGTACDCDDADPLIPRVNPCKRRASPLLAIMLGFGFAVIFSVLLIVIIVYAVRRRGARDPILLEREIGRSLLDAYWARRDAVRVQ